MVQQSKDVIQHYTQALDRGDFDALSAIWQDIYLSNDTALEAAIVTLHARFDSAESFTEQVEALRRRLREEGESR